MTDVKVQHIEHEIEAATYFKNSAYIQGIFKKHAEIYTNILRSHGVDDEKLRAANIGYNALMDVANEIMAPLKPKSERKTKHHSSDIRKALKDRHQKDSRD